MTHRKYEDQDVVIRRNALATIRRHERARDARIVAGWTGLDLAAAVGPLTRGGYTIRQCARLLGCSLPVAMLALDTHYRGWAWAHLPRNVERRCNAPIS